MHSARQLVSTLAMALVAPTVVLAQPAQTFDDLSRVARPGQAVVVTDTSGERIRGRLTEVSASELVVDDGGPRRFQAGTITRVERADSVWNGLLIGAALGGAVAALGISATRGESDAFYGWAYGASWALPAGGAAIGALVDRAVTATMYVAPRHAQAGGTPKGDRFVLNVAWTF
jgi:hypothetical protein